MWQFIKFGIVGGSGTVVNMVVTVIYTMILKALTGHGPHTGILFFEWYHVIMVLAFLTANTWNYQLNRIWTFTAEERRGWWAQFFPFLATGVFAFIVSLVVSTLLLSSWSPIELPRSIFDDSSLIRTAFYWANAISIIIALPVNFIVNKLWTFKKQAA
ncbi:MAG: GtrA family protein [Corynebacterium sp.]|nr:GtrA family protein [Corynebacterium sp.]